MYNMKTFDINRFLNASKLFLIYNWKIILAAYVGITFGFLFVEFIPSFTYHIDRLVGMIFSIIIFGFANGAIFFMHNMNKKQDRIFFLMLPISLFEKFMLRYLYITVGWLACLVLAAFTADTLRVAIAASIDFNTYEWIVPILINKSFSFVSTMGHDVITEDSDIFKVAFMVLIFLNIHAVFMLGSTVFRKYSFVFTNIVLAIVSYFMLSLLDLDAIISSISYGYVALYTLLACCFVSIFILYWLCYLAFKRMQAVNTTLINIL